MVTVSLVDHLYLRGVIIVPVSHVVNVQLIVLQVQPRVGTPSPNLVIKKNMIIILKYYFVTNRYIDILQMF